MPGKSANQALTVLYVGAGLLKNWVWQGPEDAMEFYFLLSFFASANS